MESASHPLGSGSPRIGKEPLVGRRLHKRQKRDQKLNAGGAVFWSVTAWLGSHRTVEATWQRDGKAAARGLVSRHSGSEATWKISGQRAARRPSTVALRPTTGCVAGRAGGHRAAPQGRWSNLSDGVVGMTSGWVVGGRMRECGTEKRAWDARIRASAQRASLGHSE